MQPTANNVDFMRETPAIQRLVAAADGGRWAARLNAKDERI
jgi:hypothetical protein